MRVNWDEVLGWGLGHCGCHCLAHRRAVWMVRPARVPCGSWMAPEDSAARHGSALGFRSVAPMVTVERIGKGSASPICKPLELSS